MLPVLGGPLTGRVTHGRTALTAAELLPLVHGAAAALPTGRVALDGGGALSRLVWFLAADLRGCPALLVEESWTPRERDAVLADAAATPVDASATPTGPVRDRSTGGADEPFYLPTTSGSTGRPRVLQRSRRSWQRSFALFDVPLEPADEVLVPGPLSSSLFLFGALHGLRAGAPGAGAGVRLLDRWSAVAAAREARTATVVHLVPAMLAALLAVLERDPVLRAGCALRAVICGGARVDPALADRLAKALPGCELIEYYGSAEQSLIALRRGGGALRPVVPVAVEPVDDEPVAGAGELHVRSELAFDGHLEDGVLVEASPGWMPVGDRAIQHPDGALEVLGRAATTISSGARLVSAEEVEAVLRTGDGVADVLVAPTPHPRFGALVTALVEVDPGRPPALGELRALARRELAPGKRPRRWLLTTALPRTPAGKPARALVAERLRAGTLDAWEPA
ncbi:AMP-binding protein [Saccharopolyspora cebuensis]|uniref:AMP-binding protein n=1 Tax=Saccharopolyspora cebuensis TaxID=418759 RepID=A0ABV4CT74_9PSEU